MMSGVIKNPNLTINSKTSTFSFFDNTQPFKSPTYLTSPGFSPRTPTPRGVKTQATAVKDDVVLSERETNLSFYQLLGIPEAGSFNEIKQAYKQMARKYHPDVAPSEKTKEYTKKFIEVQEAYETLSDPSTRAMYDRDMSRGLHLAFSARRGSNEGLEREEWRNQWQDQVINLKKGRGKNMSWAAQMRQKRAESEWTE